MGPHQRRLLFQSREEEELVIADVADTAGTGSPWSDIADIAGIYSY